ncbi:MAG: hypothetical protein FWC01_02115 [Treponema sp.]|nr:hypothetical protein [Treponema sp.]MCL2237094.1 hypothetical protein [Treponema sp.]
MLMQKFVGKSYSLLVEILLWIIPIIGAVTGYFISNSIYSGQTVLWILIGIIGGLLIDVLFFGPILLLMEIKSLLKKNINKS